MMRQFFYFLIVAQTAFPLTSGQKANEFSLKGIDGKEYSTAKLLKTRPYLVVAFVATKCPYSNAYNERYKRLQDALMQRNKVTFLAINANKTESPEDIKNHAKEHGFTFPLLIDEGHKVADMLGAEKTPEFFLINEKQEILYHGRMDDDSEGKNIKREDLLKAVDEAILNKPVSVKETKALGCSIKR